MILPVDQGETHGVYAERASKGQLDELAAQDDELKRLSLECGSPTSHSIIDWWRRVNIPATPSTLVNEFTAFVLVGEGPAGRFGVFTS